jgi:glycosyltransferase involved in cell wall biosynthesis
MQNIWIDVTDLFYWRGHFTGVQRVAYNYASRFSKEGTKFFIYSTYYKRFIEVPFDALAEWSRETNRLSNKRRIKKKLKKRYKALPKLARLLLQRPLMKLLHWYRFILSRTIYRAGNQKVLAGFPKVSFQKNDTILILGAAWNEESFADEITNQKIKSQLKLVIHLNDILPVYQPHLFANDLPPKFSIYIHKMLKAADIVLTISHASKADIIKFCRENDIKTPKVEIVRLGEDISTIEPKRPAIDGLKKEYILSVGTFEIRKNYLLLYQAVKLAQKEAKSLPQIIIAGRKGWLTEDLQYLFDKDPTIQDKLMHLDKLSDENLAWLYENCMFTIFPSLSEGWGLPIAESLHNGKLCLSSDTSSMPEIAGDMIDYFSPLDPKDCMNKIIEYLDDNKLVAKNKFIKENYKSFSWNESFGQFKAAITSVTD